MRVNTPSTCSLRFGVERPSETNPNPRSPSGRIQFDDPRTGQLDVFYVRDEDRYNAIEIFPTVSALEILFATNRSGQKKRNGLRSFSGTPVGCI